MARRIESGICHVNGPTVHDEAQMPFGGVKGSGYGRFGGKAGIDAFTELRWVTVQTSAAPLPVLTRALPHQRHSAKKAAPPAARAPRRGRGRWATLR